jgi:hypothetical protein
MGGRPAFPWIIGEMVFATGQMARIECVSLSSKNTRLASDPMALDNWRSDVPSLSTELMPG